MDSGTLSDATVDAFVRERFIAVRIEKEHQPATFESLKITDFPSTILLRADKTEAARLPGYLGPQEFLEKLKAASGKN
ncbi:MAG: hypothetical protein FD180_3159 [Planctomycetota bacterium]|nr:MAG: hypothetical protein FD180_3159 [Planctomycetota bacterium]